MHLKVDRTHDAVAEHLVNCALIVPHTCTISKSIDRGIDRHGLPGSGRDLLSRDRYIRCQSAAAAAFSASSAVIGA